MAIDVHQTIDAVTRTLSTRDVGGSSAWVILATRAYAASIEEVWDALTNGERIPRWFLPISGELRVGGRYRLEGNAEGEILECGPQGRLAVTWEFGGQVSWLNVQLSEDGSGGTRFELEHIAHVPEEMWNEFGPGMVGVGWDSALLGLEQHLTLGATIDPQEAVQWLSSDEGRAFVRESSDAWCAASIAAGTDRAAAEAGAARTTAAYTGEAPGPIE